MGKRRIGGNRVQFPFWRDLQGGGAPERMMSSGTLPAAPRVRAFCSTIDRRMIAHLPEIDERIRRYCDNLIFTASPPGSKCSAPGHFAILTATTSAGCFNQ